MKSALVRENVEDKRVEIATQKNVLRRIVVTFK